MKQLTILFQMLLPDLRKTFSGNLVKQLRTYLYRIHTPVEIDLLQAVIGSRSQQQHQLVGIGYHKSFSVTGN